MNLLCWCLCAGNNRFLVYTRTLLRQRPLDIVFSMGGARRGLFLSTIALKFVTKFRKHALPEIFNVRFLGRCRVWLFCVRIFTMFLRETIPTGNFCVHFAPPLLLKNAVWVLVYQHVWRGLSVRRSLLASTFSSQRVVPNEAKFHLFRFAVHSLQQAVLQTVLTWKMLHSLYCRLHVL